MVVVVAAEKGGCGKTTIATQLSILRAQHERDVLFVDADTQKSACGFFQVRESEDLAPQVSCVAITGRSVAPEVRKLIPRYEDIIIDAGGRDNAGLRSALLVADALVIPFIASQFDVWSTETMDQVIEEAQILNPELRALAVMNKSDANPFSKLAEEATGVVREQKHLMLMDVRLGYRVAFRRACAEGKTVGELFKKDAKATEELTRLYLEVFGA